MPLGCTDLCLSLPGVDQGIAKVDHEIHDGRRQELVLGLGFSRRRRHWLAHGEPNMAIEVLGFTRPRQSAYDLNAAFARWALSIFARQRRSALRRWP